MQFHRMLASLAAISGLLVATSVVAEETAGGTVSLLVDVEKFKFVEFEPKNVTAWKDDGLRASVGAAWSNLRVPTGGPVYRGLARVYYGQVDSDDVYDPLVPVATKTKYLGLQAEGLGGYRFGGKVGVELVSGIGFDVWQRDIEDGYDASGTQWAYWNELWAVLNARLGVGFFTRFDNFGFALRGGPKLPLVAWQRLYIADGADLMPKPEVSWFGQAEFTFGSRGKDNFTLVFYYDSYKFKASKFEDLTLDGVLIGTINQPDTEMKVVGARLALGF